MLFTKEMFDLTLRGAVSTYEDERGALCADRFTNAQREEISKRVPAAPYHNAGMRFDFVTDAESIAMSFRIKRLTSRIFLSIDIFEDGVLTYSYIEKNTFDKRHGSFEYNFEKKGEKRITVYLPYSADLAFDVIELSGESFVRPYTEYSSYIYMMGDSITHGYDAEITSASYANIVMRRLDADGINQGAAGYVFCADSIDPELFAGKRKPDIITVAYGTNDWAHKTKDDFTRDTVAFFDRLCEIYEGIPILCITPVFRAGYYIDTAAGNFAWAREFITESAKKHENVYVLDGDKLVPHVYDFFRDVRLHPNDAGFASYGAHVGDAVAHILGIRPKTFLI